MTPRLIQHYLELCRHYRYALLKWVLGTVIAVAAFSYLLLLTRPSYTAVASVVVLPTEAELAFSRQVSFGYETTSSISGTLLEYLVSRPVVERVLDQLQMGQNIGIEEEPETILEHLAAALPTARKAIMKGLRILDSGSYVETDPRSAALDRLTDGIDLAFIPGTMVFEIAVTLPDPQDAALAANVLAAAYMDRENDELERTAMEIELFLKHELAEDEASLLQLRAEEIVKRQELGLESLEGQAEALQSARETERRNQMDARVRRVALESQLSALAKERESARSREALRRVEQDISTARASIEALRDEEAIRAEALRSLSAQLDALYEKERPISELTQRIDEVEADFKNLRDELFQNNLNRAATANKVRLVNPAVEPPYPSFPRVVLNVVLGGFAAFFLGMVTIVAADTFSGTVKTEEDLRALDVPPLGVWPPRVRELKGSTKPRLRRRWEALRRSMLERLALFGMLDGETIRLAGFVSEEELESHSLLVAEGLRADRAGRPGDDPAGGAAGAIRVDCLPPVGESFRWARIDAGDSVLCLVPAGRVSEDQIRGFADGVASRGAKATFVVLEG